MGAHMGTALRVCCAPINTVSVEGDGHDFRISVCGNLSSDSEWRDAASVLCAFPPPCRHRDGYGWRLSPQPAFVVGNQKMNRLDILLDVREATYRVTEDVVSEIVVHR